jgi:hypothetical protein
MDVAKRFADEFSRAVDRAYELVGLEEDNATGLLFALQAAVTEAERATVWKQATVDAATPEDVMRTTVAAMDRFSALVL